MNGRRNATVIIIADPFEYPCDRVYPTTIAGIALVARNSKAVAMQCPSNLIELSDGN
jgi:hypothetical protein